MGVNVIASHGEMEKMMLKKPIHSGAGNKPIRWTLEMMQAIAVERGGRCLSPTYVHTTTHLDWECAQGHRWQAMPLHIKRGTWCPICSVLSRRGSLENIQAIAESRGGRCLSDRYAGSNVLHLYECQWGHRWQARPAQIKLGSWCRRCRYDRMLTPIERIRDIAVKRGGQCLSEIYVNCDAPLRWRCARGHEWEASSRYITANRWCQQCANANQHLGIDLMRAIAAQRGGLCLSDTYVNANTKLTWQCENGHVWQAIPTSIKNAGCWCRQCYLDGLRKPKQRLKRKRKGGVPIML